MSRNLSILCLILAVVSSSGSVTAQAEEAPNTAPRLEAVISVEDQKVAVLRNGALVARYPVSTSKFGTGDGQGSYKTPLGRMRICDKIGGRLASGSVLKRRAATGEVLPVNAPGRDPIVTRILWLEGMESQNENARSRSIYIHGTPDEAHIGKPVSWGCIRMRSRDVLALYENLNIGSPVTIIAEGLPRYPKFDPASEVIIARKAPPAPPQTIAANLAKTPATQAQEISNAEANLAANRSLPRSTPPPAIASREVRAPRVQPGRDAVVRSRPGTQVFTSTPQVKSGRGSDLSSSMNQSILLSGLEEPGNSEIPRLGR